MLLVRLLLELRGELYDLPLVSLLGSLLNVRLQPGGAGLSVRDRDVPKENVSHEHF